MAVFCEGHEPGFCQCDLKFYITSNYATNVLRVIKREKKTDIDMIYEMIYWLEGHYKYYNYKYNLKDKENKVAAMSLALAMSQAPNMYVLPKVHGLPRYSMPISTPLPKPNDILVNAYKTWDYHNFKTSRQPHFFRTTPELARVLPLRQMCEMRFSAYNMAYGYNSYGKLRSVQARDNLYEKEKLLKLHQEFARNTNDISPEAAESFSRHGVQALQLLYSHFLKTDKYFGKYRWKYDRTVFQETIPVNFSSSAGLNMQTEQIVERGDVRYVKRRAGFKKENMEQFFLLMNRLHGQAQRGEELDEIKRGVTNIAMKNEVFNDWEKSTKEQCDKIHFKCRHFAITEIVENLMAAAIGKFRQHIERGKYIRIGMKWWKGGVDAFAKLLKYDPILYPDQIYDTGDFEKFDKGVVRFLLQLYLAEAARYIDPTFDGPDRVLWEHIFKFLIDAIGTKIVHMPGGVWAILFGVMPSGHCDTSHGDSWIVLFLYCMLLITVMKGPKRRLVMKYLKEKRIIIVVYGDDFIISVPLCLHSVLGVKAFARYVRMWGMVIRDMKTVPFLSEVGERGELKVEGACFLQRYFIKSSTMRLQYEGMPTYLPFRPAHKTITKLAFGNGSGRTLIDIVLAINGHAYDTMGTNEYAYLFLLHVYQRVMKEALEQHDDFEQQLAMYIDSSDSRECLDITKLMRKACITKEELKQFPSYENLLKRNCNFDREYHYTRRDIGLCGLYYSTF
jgi:hypothetical protein